MSPTVHVIIVIALFIFFIVSFLKERRAYQIVFSVWVLSTLLKYVSDDKIFTYVLGGAQLVFFVVAIYMLFRNKNSNVKKLYSQIIDQDEGDLDINDSKEESK